MSDTSLAVFLHYGTNAQRLAFTPAPAATGQPLYEWYESDTGKTYVYSTAWHPIVGAGGVVQVVNTQTGAVATGTTTIPADDTIPQNTEGTQFMTLAITPTLATNKLRIEVVFVGSSSVATETAIMGLFQDTTADALAADWVTIGNATGAGFTLPLSHYMTAGTTSATTFKVRVGTAGASTVTFNGAGGNRKLGGVIASSITITEIAV